MVWTALKRPLALMVLLGISLALRGSIALALHFDGLYGQDAYAYYSYGQQLLAAAARFQLPGHFYWPLGYPALVALGFLLTGEQPLGPQIVSLMAGAAVSVLAFGMTVTVFQAINAQRNQPVSPNKRSRQFVRVAGVIAWAIVTVCGQLTQSSLVIMSDAAGLMWATLSAWALLLYGRARQPGWIALSALTLAFATMTRWQYASLALPWALFVMLNRPIRWCHAALAVVIGLAALTPQIAHSILTSDLPITHEWVQGWSPDNIFARDFVTPDGTFHYSQTPAEYYSQPLYNVYYMSPIFLPLIALGLIRLRGSRPTLILVTGWIAVQYAFLIGIPYENIRFALALVPPLAVLAGIGAAWALSARSVMRVVVAPLIVYGLIGTLTAAIPIIRNFVAAKNNDLAAARWIEGQIPEHAATVLCLDLLLTMQHYTALHPVQIYEQTPAALQNQLTPPAYAVFNVWTTEHQWYGKSPWTIYHWLKDEVGMTEIGTFGLYTLYRVELMNIGILIPGFSDGENDWCIPVYLNLVRTLAQTDAVRVFALRYPPRRDVYPVYGAQVYALGGNHQTAGVGRAMLLLRTITAVIRQHRVQPFDVLHAIWADETGFAACLAGRLIGVPVMVSVAGGELAHLPDYGLQSGRVTRWLVEQALTCADGVIAPCEYAADLARQTTPRIKRLETVPLGVDTTLFSPVPGSKNRLLAVGSLIPMKGHGQLLQALTCLPGVELDIIGEGPLLAPLRELASSLGIASQVRFQGAVAHDCLPRFYQDAALHVLTSRHEAFGMVVAEAAACGLPTVGFAVGVLPEYHHNRAGIAVPPEDIEALAAAIQALLADPAQLAAYRQAARQLAESRYSLASMSGGIRSLYCSVIAEKTTKTKPRS